MPEQQIVHGSSNNMQEHTHVGSLSSMSRASSCGFSCGFFRRCERFLAIQSSSSFCFDSRMGVGKMRGVNFIFRTPPARGSGKGASSSSKSPYSTIS